MALMDPKMRTDELNAHVFLESVYETLVKRDPQVHEQVAQEGEIHVT